MSMNFKRIFPHVSIPGIAQKLYEDINYNAVIGKRTHYGERGVDVAYKVLVDEVSANTVVGGAYVWRNDITKNDGSFKQMAIPYYKVQSSFTTTADSQAKFNKLDLGISEDEFKKAITFQAMAQRRAHITFFGAEPSEKQGLFNAASVTTALPADSAANDKLSSYVPGELLDFLVSQVREVANISYNMLKPIVIAAPINAVNYLKSKIVPVDKFLKDAGTLSVSKTLDNIVYDINGMQIQFVPCSYMAGKGTGKKDVMLIVAPGIEVKEEDRGSTAYLNNIGDEYVNTFIDDALELEEYQNPNMYQVNEWIFTSIYTPAYTVRADAVRCIEYNYA